MKTFKYRFERVLQFRESVREEKLRELLGRKTVLFQAQEVLKRYQELAVLTPSPEIGTYQLEEFLLRGQFAEGIQKQIENQRTKIEQAEREYGEALATYQEAEREAEALRRLKKKKQADHLELSHKEEGKFLDELTTQQSGRKS